MSVVTANNLNTARYAIGVRASHWHTQETLENMYLSVYVKQCFFSTAKHQAQEQSHSLVAFLQCHLCKFKVHAPQGLWFVRVPGTVQAPVMSSCVGRQYGTGPSVARQRSSNVTVACVAPPCIARVARRLGGRSMLRAMTPSAFLFVELSRSRFCYVTVM